MSICSLKFIRFPLLKFKQHLSEHFQAETAQKIGTIKAQLENGRSYEKRVYFVNGSVNSKHTHSSLALGPFVDSCVPTVGNLSSHLCLGVETFVTVEFYFPHHL